MSTLCPPVEGPLIQQIRDEVCTLQACIDSGTVTQDAFNVLALDLYKNLVFACDPTPTTLAKISIATGFPDVIFTLADLIFTPDYILECGIDVKVKSPSDVLAQLDKLIADCEAAKSAAQAGIGEIVVQPVCNACL